MKKMMLVFFLVAFILCGCNHQPNRLVTPIEEKTTIVEASDLVRKMLPDQEYEYNIQYEGDKTFEDEEYFVFRVYTVSSQTISGTDGGDPFQMQFTHGVYYVHPFDKEVFKLSTGDDCLIKQR